MLRGVVIRWSVELYHPMGIGSDVRQVTIEKKTPDEPVPTLQGLAQYGLHHVSLSPVRGSPYRG